jgi:indolepyruvate ferredoxin oxidoreductase
MTQNSQIDSELHLLQAVEHYDLDVEKRTPSYCAGCPHRGSSSAIMELRKRFADTKYMKNRHNSTPIDIISHGGIGCYSLNFLPPFRDMHNMSAMGLGGAAGMGAYSFTTNKHYVMCGDSTFFHSEMSTLSNAIKDNQDILYLILDNKNTAMTGHQGTAGSAYDIMGYKTIEQDIESVVRGMDSHGKVFIRRVNPSERDSYMGLLEKAFLMDGVRVIIADRECAITYHKKQRALTALAIKDTGFLKQEKHINITPDVCENCRECTTTTGCPGLKIVDTHYGEKIAIDQSICVDDKYCTKVKACPSFEEVIIRRSKGAKKKTGNWDLWMRDIPDPEPFKPFEGDADTFYTFIPGVGGMGLGFIARILTEAGAKEGFHVNYYHQKGLAQRNGAVVSHVLYSRDPVHVSQRIPKGKANLILGLDYLETVRGLKYSSVARTSVVCNKAKTPTVKMLLGEDSFPLDLKDRIMEYSKADNFFGADFFNLSEHYFGNRLYANLMMLGTAYQRGLLPINGETIEEVVRESVQKSQRENNLRAFRIGRRLVSHPEMLHTGSKTESYSELVEDKVRRLEKSSSKDAKQYQKAMKDYAAQMSELPGLSLREFARRYYDLIAYDNKAYADSFAKRIVQVYNYELNLGGNGLEMFAASDAVINNLYKVMAIKDEIWVAHLLTRSEKFEEDMERYNINPDRGDSIKYIHINRPHFDVMGMHIEWDMKTRNWMLNIMKRMKFIRKILPNWHKRERAFREWYKNDVVGAFLAGGFSNASDALLALKQPFECSGYREIVYPKQDAARKLVAQLLNGEPENSPEYIPLEIKSET